jgi:hypothetical protein
MRNGTIATAALVAVYSALAAGILPAWLADNVSGITLLVVPAGLLAAAFLTFFSWRSSLRRRFVSDVEDLPRAA